MNEQQNFWASDYAREYISKNNEFDQDVGTEAWRKILVKTKDINSLLECGCNIGRNIGFLNQIMPQVRKSIIEISKPAFDLVKKQSVQPLEYAFNGSIEDSWFPRTFDLVFTMGVLIHIHPDDLLANMKKMYDHSCKYVLIGEYFNRTPVMIEYQGKKDKLFKRDFGKMFVDNFSVKLVDYGFLWGYIYDKAGFDDITWWLFQKD